MSKEYGVIRELDCARRALQHIERELDEAYPMLDSSCL